MPRKVFKNTGIVIAGQLVTKVIGLAVTIYLARYLGGENFGIYNLIFSFIGFFAIISKFGMDDILVRDIAREKGRASLLLGNAILMKSLLTLIGIIACIVSVWLLHYPIDTTKLITVSSIYLAFMTFNQMYETIFQANLAMKYPTAVNVFGGLLLSTLIFVGIVAKMGLAYFVLAFAFYLIPGLVFLMYISRTLVHPDFRVDLKVWRYLFKESWPLIMMSLFVITNNRIDVLFLSKMRTDLDIGYYAAAYRLTEALGVIPMAISCSMYPLLSQYYHTDRDYFHRVYQYGMKYIIILAVLLAVGGAILAGPIIDFLYGAKYAPAAGALAILCVTEATIFIGYIQSQGFTAINRQKINTLMMGLMTLISVLFNLLLIPKFSFIGSSITTLISQGFGLAMGLYFMNKFVGKLMFSWWPILASGMLMGLGIYWIDLPVLVRMAIGAVIYVACLYLFKGINTQDRDLFAKVFRKNK
ncbi:MAG: flippase [bacterium]|nr:flippase [bacterium]